MGAESTVRTFHIWVVVIQNSGLEVFRSKVFDSLEDGVHRAFLHLESVQAALGRVLVHLEPITAFKYSNVCLKKRFLSYLSSHLHITPCLLRISYE